MKKHWLTLIIWFLSPLVISSVFHRKITFELLVYGLMLPYWLFVMASFAYEGTRIMSYVKNHFPREYKKRMANNTLDHKFLTSFAPALYDEKWKTAQARYRSSLRFTFISLLLEGCFALVYFTFFVTGSK